ncbi:MAG: hypothetical protein ACO3GP_02415 [Candidatus Limnocylindrus sp.]
MVDMVEQNNNADGGAVSNTGSAALPADVAARLARLDEVEKKLAQVTDEAAQRRIAAKQERERAEKLAEEQGQFKALADSYKARIAELEPQLGPLEEQAKRWQAFENRERQRIQSMRASLPAHWQAALDAAGSLEAQQAVLQAIDAENASGKRSPAKAPPGGNPAAGAVDFSQVANDPAALRAAKEADPTGWERFKLAMRRTTGVGETTFARRQAMLAGAKRG